MIICILGAPVVLSNLSSPVIGVIGRSTTLTFNIIEDNPIVIPDDIQWLLNDNELHAGGRISFSIYKRSIIISRLQLLDEGVYTLIASNAAGTSRSSIYLDVEGR